MPQLWGNHHIVVHRCAISFPLISITHSAYVVLVYVHSIVIVPLYIFRLTTCMCNIIWTYKIIYLVLSTSIYISAREFQIYIPKPAWLLPPLFLYLSLLYKPLYPLPPRSTPSTLYPSPEGGVGYSLRIKVYVTVLNIIRDCKLLTVIWCWAMTFMVTVYQCVCVFRIIPGAGVKPQWTPIKSYSVLETQKYI